MRKYVAVAAAIAVGVSGTAVAAGVNGMATGGVTHPTTNGETARSQFNAKAGPHGPQGVVNRKVRDAVTNEVIRDFMGNVDCYHQEGNTAWFSGPITMDRGNDGFEGQYFIWVAQDNGAGKKAPPDQFRAERSATPVDCATKPIAPTQPVDNGSITVHKLK
jgi:hypothetical protein